MKNIAIFVMSTFQNNPKFYNYTSDDGFSQECSHTNEVGLKYIMWKLAQQDRKLDGAYAFVTEEAEKQIEGLRKLFVKCAYEPNIKSLRLEDNGSLKGSFRSVGYMLNMIRNDLQENVDDISFYVDVTGGPRSASVLMLALMQMLKFYGYRTNLVIYSSLTKVKDLLGIESTVATVENASDLLEMYDLMSGTQSFISYGDVNEIKGYFGNKDKCSSGLRELLNAMQDLSSALKICASYEDMVVVLQSLNSAILAYEDSLNKNRSVDDREKFFSKLLPKIENEYSKILPDKNGEINVVELIRWCLAKDMLQQAMTIYTEGLPSYVINNGYIEVLDKDIENSCEKMGQDYKSWHMKFFRGYTLPIDFINEYVVNILKKKVVVDDIVGLKYLLEKINNEISIYNDANYSLAPKIKLLFDEVKMLGYGGNPNAESFALRFKKLPSTGVVKSIFNDKNTSQQDTDSFVVKMYAKFLKEQLKKEYTTSVSEFVFRNILNYNKESLKNILSVPLSKELAQCEDNMFHILLKLGKLRNNAISEIEMISLIDNYRFIVGHYRNKSNHFNANVGINEEISRRIYESLESLK